MTKIAILIPTHNRPEMLKEMLDSISRQTFKDLVVYVSDSGFNPVTKCLLDFYPMLHMHYRNDSNEGGHYSIGRRLKIMVENAIDDGAEFIQFLCDDDILEDTYLEECLERLEEGDIDWVTTHGSTFGEYTNGVIDPYVRTLKEQCERNAYPYWLLGKASMFKEVNYRGDIPYFDWDLHIRLLQKGYKGGVIAKKLVKYRIHPLSDSKTGALDNWEAKRDILLKANNCNISKKIYHMGKHYRFHHLGIPHLPLAKEYSACAFTQKLIKFNRMLLDMGHEVYFYGAKSASWDAERFYNSDRFHFVETHTVQDIKDSYGVGENDFETGYDWKKHEFKHDFCGAHKPVTIKFVANAIDNINKIKRPDDFLLLTQGWYHKEIDDNVRLYLTCEPGIGYRGSYCKFRAFEGSAIRYFMLGSEHPRQVVNTNFNDRVIPNYFDPNDVTFSTQKSDYALFIARLHWDKGLTIAYDTCKVVGLKLKVAGQGGMVAPNGDLHYPGGKIPHDPIIEHVGCLGFEERKKEMAHAKAVFTPSIYLDPFCGTHVEAMLSGTPPITSDFGIFPETIPNYLNGTIGFRCNTLDDYVKATRKALTFKEDDYRLIRDYSERYLMDNVRPEFQKWFDDLMACYEGEVAEPKRSGWYKLYD